MANIRFARVVEHSGRPEVYLILTDPKRDAHFQAALKAHRLMTIQHGSGGSQASFGTVGYLPEVRGEVLLFPRSLRTFADDRIVGINFDLLEQEREPVEEEKPAPQIVPKPKAIAEKKFEEEEEDPVPKSPAQAHPRSQLASQQKGKGKRAQADDHPELPLERETPRPPAKVISFHGHEAGEKKEEEGEEAAEMAALKKEIRRALKALEAGKQVVAFNILKGLLD
jgi:hypothetical protein